MICSMILSISSAYCRIRAIRRSWLHSIDQYNSGDSEESNGRLNSAFFNAAERSARYVRQSNTLFPHFGIEPTVETYGLPVGHNNSAEYCEHAEFRPEHGIGTEQQANCQVGNNPNKAGD